MTIWRFTGNPENWLTAIGRKNWALNENNRNLWDSQIKPGDVAIFHSTANSDFDVETESAVIGFGYVGEPLYKKEELWWIQETRDNENKWPYVVPLKEVYLFSQVDGIDFEKDIQVKDATEVAADIQKLLASAIAIRTLNDRAASADPGIPRFPVNGSASRINPFYEKAILEQKDDFFVPSETQQTDSLERRLSESIDDQIFGLSTEEALKKAHEYVPTIENFTTSTGVKRVRKESQKQKRLLAKSYDYTCQRCGFRCEYLRTNGKTGYIIEVDHINDKAKGGNEAVSNLWVLCPNCHEKKTRGVIKIDMQAKKVTEGGAEVTIKDLHLFV